MNLDNYFARFLHKGPTKTGKAVAARSGEALAVAPTFSASPTALDESRASSNAAEAPRPQQQAVPSALNTSPDAAGRFPSVGDARGRTAAVEGAVGEDEDLFDSASLKRPREAPLPLAPLTSTSTPAAAPAEAPAAKRQLTRRIVDADGGDAEDDEDELALLLGSQKARQVREVDAMLEGVTRAQQTAAAAASTSSPTTAADDFPGAVAVGSLAWQTTSSAKRATLASYFQRQFEWELQHSADLFDAFEAFFRDRALDRIRTDTSLRPVLRPAPAVVTPGMIAALPGCALRSYQLEGVQFLLHHFHRGMPCILGDDMGLGKTAQISAFLHTLKQLHHIDGPHLIVAPLSTLTSWTRELARWAPQLRVAKYHGDRRAREAVSADRHNRHAVFVTTPALLHLDKRVFRKRTWVAVIVDEAHVLKAHDTAVTSTSRKLTACFRVAVTGTPVHNRVQEVWSLMSFLYPPLMAGYDPSRRDPVREAEECAKVLQHVMLRRTKADMELGIPPRIDEPVTRLEPTYVQLQLLSLLTAHALHEGGTGHQLHAHLSHQRAVCNHPLALRLLADEGRVYGSKEPIEARMRAAGVPMDAAHLIAPSAKMRHLDALLPRLQAEGHRCLLFSNFTSTLDLLEAMCRLRGYSYERLDGSCNRVERELAMLRYNHAASSCFLFLVTTTAGGVGVTLTGADTVILFDAHFNPQLDRQAADRAHRIGQTRPVHVHRLCLHGTIEEHIRDVAARKAALGDFIVEGGQRNGSSASRGAAAAATPRITADDIREMFERFEARQRHPASPTASPTSGTAGDMSSSGNDGGGSAPCDRAAEDALVESLLRIEERGLRGSAAAAAVRAGGGDGGFAAPPRQTHHCFCCGAIMRPLEPLLHCMVCPKAYHATCIGERPPKPGEAASAATRRHWSCPRHACAVCGKQQAADGAIFMCDACPRSFCFDCLDPRYLEMDATGTRLLHIRDTYAGMDEMEVVVKRSCYYVTCLRCCGVVSSSASATDAGEGSGSDEERESATAVDSDGFEVVDGDDDD